MPAQTDLVAGSRQNKSDLVCNSARAAPLSGAPGGRKPRYVAVARAVGDTQSAVGCAIHPVDHRFAEAEQLNLVDRFAHQPIGALLFSGFFTGGGTPFKYWIGRR